MELFQTDGILVAVLPKEIDHHSAVSLREEIDRAILEDMPKKVRLDFSHVSFMDSSGMGLVMGRYQKVQRTGGALEVTGTSGRVRKMLDIGGLTKLIEIK